MHRAGRHHLVTERALVRRCVRATIGRVGYHAVTASCEMTMRRLLSLLLLFFALPAAAGLFDSRPSVTLGGLNNSADF